MATSKVTLRSVEEFMQDYTPTYQPLYPLFLGKSQAWTEEVGKVAFTRVNTVGDIRTRHVTPKDTEIRQVAVGEAKKTFRKYFLANQFTISALQNRVGVEDVIAQVLDEHQKQADELFLFGEGTSNTTMINNGLFWSDDSNYVLKTSAAVAAGAAADHLADLHQKIVGQKAEADAVAGRKAVIFYGATAIAKLNGVYASQPVPFKRVLAEVLGPQYSLVEMPAAVTPAASNGWLIANLDQCKLNYTALPALKDQGINQEKMYAWFNFMMGSMMLEVLTPGGVIRQPATFA